MKLFQGLQHYFRNYVIVHRRVSHFSFFSKWRNTLILITSDKLLLKIFCILDWGKRVKTVITLLCLYNFTQNAWKFLCKVNMITIGIWVWAAPFKCIIFNDWNNINQRLCSSHQFFPCLVLSPSVSWAVVPVFPVLPLVLVLPGS